MPRLHAEALEAREVPTVGMSLAGGKLRLTAHLLGSSVIVIDNDPLNTPAVNDNTLTVIATNANNPQGNWVRTVAKSGVQRITFVGGLGNDTFENGTGLPSTASGGQGQDAFRGGWGSDEFRGGMGNDVLYGGRGDDTLYGERGIDRLYGDTPGSGSSSSPSGGDDRLEGGEDTDYLYGGGGDDALRGGLGRDYLYGEAGNDSLYGGAEYDFLYGNAGADRYLLNYHVEEVVDTITGLGAEDVRVRFWDRPARTVRWSESGTERTVFGRGEWAEGEIEIVDSALGVLVDKVGSNVLLRKPGGGEVNFYRHGAIDETASTVDDVTAYNYAGDAYYNDSTFARGREAARATVWHEIGHNLHEAELVEAILPGKGNLIDSFRDLSGWVEDSWFTHPLLAIGYRESRDGQWLYRGDATFARDYGQANPYEDFATVFAAYVQVVAGEPPELAQNINQKLFHIDALMYHLRERYGV